MLEPDFNPFAKMSDLDEDDPNEKIKSMDQTSAFNTQMKMSQKEPSPFEATEEPSGDNRKTPIRGV